MFIMGMRNNEDLHSVHLQFTITSEKSFPFFYKILLQIVMKLLINYFSSFHPTVYTFPILLSTSPSLSMTNIEFMK